jgi:hypothetical protein
VPVESAAGVELEVLFVLELVGVVVIDVEPVMWVAELDIGNVLVA